MAVSLAMACLSLSGVQSHSCLEFFGSDSIILTRQKARFLNLLD